MKKRKLSSILIALLLVFTTVIAGAYLSCRTAAPEGCITITASNESSVFRLSQLNWSQVQGQIKTGKGEVRNIDAQGVPVKEVLTLAKIKLDAFAGIDVTAEDGYHAELTAEEIIQPHNAYFVRQDDGGIRLIVLGDQNSKRNVTNVAGIQILE